MSGFDPRRGSRRYWLAQAATIGGVIALSSLSTSIAQGAGVPDARLIDHSGRSVRLRSDVWRDRWALVNFVFTSCSSFCGIQSAMLADLQGKLASRLGSDLVFISISVDPLTDNPTRLAEFARPFHPGPHWWWLTGEPREVFRTLEALGAYSGIARDHAPLWLSGLASGPRRMVGLPSLPQLLAAVERRPKDGS